MNCFLLETELMVFAAVSFILTKMIVPVFLKIFSEAGFIRSNFRGEQIPLGIGIVFYVAAAFVLTAGRSIDRIGTEVHIFLFATGAMALFGLIDDIFGTKQASGLAGHFRKMFFEREVTTGALKAVAGGCLALAVSAELNTKAVGNLAVLLLDAVIIALSTNLINLLDLRPGRAGKGFLLFAFFVTAVTSGRENLLYLAVVIGSLAALLPLDLRAKAMMGDAGSNTLGFALGFTAASSLGINAKIVFLAVLAGVHVVTEKYSLTRIIEKNKLLNYIDLIGRK